MVWFKRAWSPKRWNDGHLVTKGKGKGRFWVHYPPCSKKGYKYGYVLRAYAVWEIYRGKIPKGYVIHHKDGNRSNDRLYNLQLMKRSEHTRLHFTKSKIKVNCKNCGKVLFVHQWRINKCKEHLYCSKSCSMKKRWSKYNKWSKKHKCCILCKTISIRHQGHGLCQKCYLHKYNMKMNVVKKWKS